MLCGSTKQITRRKTSDQYLIVKVIPLSLHISDILGTNAYNKRHCPLETRYLLSNSKLINLVYLHNSFRLNHILNGISSGRKSILMKDRLIKEKFNNKK